MATSKCLGLELHTKFGAKCVTDFIAEVPETILGTIK